MIKSMTGFGRSTVTIGEKIFTVEVRSLNSKQLDLVMRLPSLFKEKESDIRTLISEISERGKVEFTINGENHQEIPTPVINKEIAKAYALELRRLVRELDLPESDLLHVIMKMPDVMKPQKDAPVLDELVWKTMKTAVNQALKSFDMFRTDEGRVLDTELKKRISLIQSFLKKIEALDKKRYANVSGRIKKSLREHIGQEPIDKNRFEQELIYYFEKLDITEEKLRLKTHCDYFLATMKDKAPGRKLGFISQEIGREINTIGSKANDAAVQKLVVQMKDELEKIKEQLMNVL